MTKVRCGITVTLDGSTISPLIPVSSRTTELATP